ncbi:MAG: 5-oxoprolinase subunit PxpB [Desulfobacteraceae bacterium]|nr:MAG: 5-oxoprolinase subunit PxpB [Desulfobacteraceae bacterium]
MIGDRALLVETGERVHPLVNRKVRELFAALKQVRIDGVIELVPAYRSLMIVFDPLRISHTELKHRLRRVHYSADPSRLPQPSSIEVPVRYGGEDGPDLEWVARYHGMSPEEVIRLHTGAVYQIYMIGFSPGFPYMGELPDELVTPRRETPRVKVPQGSVAIAQNQTGIYPVSSPGGWQILGRTSLCLFDAFQWPPTPLQMGDFVKFIAI